MDPETVINTIADARGLEKASTLSAGMRSIIKSVTDLAQDLLNKNINMQQKPLERAASLTSLSESFADSSKEEVLEHLNKVVEASSNIVRAAMRLEESRLKTEALLKAEEGYTEAAMEAQENAEGDLATALIEEIKTFHNGAPEEATTKLHTVIDDDGEAVIDVDDSPDEVTTSEDLNDDDAPGEGDAEVVQATESTDAVETGPTGQ